MDQATAGRVHVHFEVVFASRTLGISRLVLAPILEHFCAFNCPAERVMDGGIEGSD
jgi:hypothetical protein